MRKLLFLMSILLCSFARIPSGEGALHAEEPIDQTVHTAKALYSHMNLEGIMNWDAFKSAYEGYSKLSTRNNSILTVIDFSMPSTKKRLYVIDMVNQEVLFNSLVSHGRNSGDLYATSFSNTHGSHKSSLGFYETEQTYSGGNGYSLVLNGLESGINDQAKSRAIVMHGASYCTAAVAAQGRLGRSFGCPSVPPELAKPIINTIKGGTLLYIHARNNDYFAKSKIFAASAYNELALQ